MIVRSFLLSLAILLMPCIVQAGTGSFQNRSEHQVSTSHGEAGFPR